MQAIHRGGLSFALLSCAALLSGCQVASTKPHTASIKVETKGPSLSARQQAESVYEVLVAEMVGQQGDLATAYALLMRAAQIRHQGDLYQRAMQAALQMGDADRALAAAKAWLATDPDSREANKAVLQVLLASNQIQASEPYLQRELQTTPEADMEENLYAVPLIYLRAPDQQQVLKTARAAMVDLLKPGSRWRGDALAALGRIELQAGSNERALDYLREAEAADPKASGVGFLALDLYRAGVSEAAAPLQAYARRSDANPQFLLSYARLLIEQNQLPQALGVLKRVTGAGSEMPEAWLAQAALEAGEGDYNDALNSVGHFEDALRRLPPSPLRQRGFDEGNVLRAQIADMQGDYAAAAHYMSLVQTPEVAARAQIERAQVLARMGHMDEAFKAIAAVPDVDDEMEDMKIHAEVELLRETGQYAKAYALLAPLARAYPADDALQYELALLAEREGRYKEMEQRLRAVIARSPDYFHALNALGYSFVERDVHMKEARQLIERAVELAPNNPYVLDSLGWLEYREGNLEAAREALEQAWNAEPQVEIGAHLGEVLWKLGRQQEARSIWRQAFLSDPDNTVLRETVERLDGHASTVLVIPGGPSGQEGNAQ